MTMGPSYTNLTSRVIALRYWFFLAVSVVFRMRAKADYLCGVEKMIINDAL